MRSTSERAFIVIPESVSLYLERSRHAGDYAQAVIAVLEKRRRDEYDGRCKGGVER